MSNSKSKPSGMLRFLLPTIIVLILTASLASCFAILYVPPSSLPRIANNQSDASHYKYIDPKTGYRMGHYRAPTPPALRGATRINAKQLTYATQKSGALLIDVMAHIGAGWDPISGEWLISKPRLNIPGSIWLPDVGAGHLSIELEKYFKSNIAQLTKNDKSMPLIIYCQSDCWMSWNAVRRLRDWGYTHLLWYPEGSDGWLEAGHKLVNATPIPLDIK